MSILYTLTLQRLDALVHLSQVQFRVSHTRNTDMVLVVSTRLPSGDQATATSPPPVATEILVATPSITSHTTRWASTGEAEMSRSPWGLQDMEVMTQWPGTVSVRTQEERSLGTGGERKHVQHATVCFDLNSTAVYEMWLSCNCV